MTATSHVEDRKPQRLGELEAAIWLLPIALWAVAAWFTWDYAVNVPYLDTWDSTELVTGERPLTLGALWAQHNEHRLVVHRLFEVAWAATTGWDLWSAAFVPMLLVALAAILFAADAVRERPMLRPAQRMLLVAVLSFWFFTMRQFELLLWSMVVTIGLLLLLFVLFGIALRRYMTTGRGAWAVLSIALLAVLSHAHGLALCILLILLAVAAAIRGEARARGLVMMGLCAAGLIALYFVGFEPAKEHPPIAVALMNPMGMLDYLVVALGSPFAATLDLATWLGILIAVGLGVALIAFVRRSAWDGVWGLLTRYATLTASGIVLASLVLSRTGFGSEQASASRYIPFTVLFVASGLLLGLDLLMPRRPKMATALLSVLLAASVPLWFFGYGWAATHGWLWREGLSQFRQCVLGNPGQEAICIGDSAYPSPEVLRRRIAALRASSLTFFAPADADGDR